MFCLSFCKYLSKLIVDLEPIPQHFSAEPTFDYYSQDSSSSSSISDTNTPTTSYQRLSKSNHYSTSTSTNISQKRKQPIDLSSDNEAPSSFVVDSDNEDFSFLQNTEIDDLFVSAQEIPTKSPDIAPPPPKIKLNKRGHPRKVYNMQGRRLARAPVEKVPKKSVSLIDRAQIIETLQKGCCKQHCLLNYFSATIIHDYRARYANKTEKERTKFLRQYAEGALRANLQNKFYFEWNVNGHRICEQAFCKVFGPSAAKLQKAKDLCMEEEVKHGNTNLPSTNNKWDINWEHEMNYFLETYVMEMGDKLPDSVEVHLPVYIKPADLHTEFVQTIKAEHRELTSDVCLRNLFHVLIFNF